MSVVYGKPSLTNLPPELGQRIFQQIFDAKPISKEELAAKRKAVMEKMKEAKKALNEKR